MNIDVRRIEFIVTHRCSGQCAHCSDAPSRQGEVVLTKLDATRAAQMISDIAGRYEPDSIMTFGGEPLLYPDTVCAIHKAAYEEGIPQRQLITNGFFTKSPSKIREVARKLVAAGVTDILISVDAFHQEHIPLPTVRQFAEALLDAGFYDLKFHPAWLKSPESNNTFNRETRKILESLEDTGIEVSEGNVIFPAGAALQNLASYFPDDPDLTVPCGSAPYSQRPDQLTTLSVEPSGSVYACAMPLGSLRTAGILELLDRFDPMSNPAGRALLEGGVPALAEYAKSVGVEIDESAYKTACGLCQAIFKRL